MSVSRVFKGATRPAMVFGVPLVPHLLLCLVTLLPFSVMVVIQKYLIALMLVVVFATLFIWMRVLTRQDPWRTKQEILRLTLRAKKGNIQTWGGVSYGPIRLKKRTK